MYPAAHTPVEWNHRLAFDMALCLEGSGFALDELMETHKVTREDLVIFNQDKIFRQTVQNYRDEIREKGLSFRLKARAQAEELLVTSWNLIHDIDVSPTVKADLIKWTAKMGNLEPKPAETTVDTSGGVRITINLGNTPEAGLRTIDAVPSKVT